MLKVATVINEEQCNGCGLCVKVCPSMTLSLINGKARVTGEFSLGCDHCAAVCPAKAVTVGHVNRDMIEFNSFKINDKWTAPGKNDPAELANLMLSRRSCRNYKEVAVQRETLDDLVKFAAAAPSGTNSQNWTFIIAPDRASVKSIGEKMMGFFKKLNSLASNKGARIISKFFMKDALGIYYREYYESVKESIEEYERGGKDRLFHGAPALIFIGGKPGASCPAEDALLATQNLLLGAHALGLGTCLIGFAVEAIKRDAAVRKSLNLAAGEKIYAVAAVGWPDEKYARIAFRKPVTPRYL